MQFYVTQFLLSATPTEAKHHETKTEQGNGARLGNKGDVVNHRGVVVDTPAVGLIRPKAKGIDRADTGRQHTGVTQDVTRRANAFLIADIFYVDRLVPGPVEIG